MYLYVYNIIEGENPSSYSVYNDINVYPEEKIFESLGDVYISLLQSNEIDLYRFDHGTISLFQQLTPISDPWDAASNNNFIFFAEGAYVEIYAFDSEPPVIKITNPKENNSIILTNTVTISWDAWDDVKVDYFKIYLDGEKYGYLTTNSYVFKNLSEEEHIFEVIAFDIAGRNSSITIKFRVVIDVENPYVEIVNPDNGTYLNKTSITIKWKYSDDEAIDHFNISLDNAPSEDVGERNNYTLTDLKEGWHTFKVIAVDIANKTSEDNISFCIDLTPPQIDIKNPSNDSELTNGNITILWNVTDNFEIDKVFLRIDDGNLIDITGTVEYNITLGEGDHKIAIIAFDKAGNKAKKYVVFTISIPSEEQKPGEEMPSEEQQGGINILYIMIPAIIVGVAVIAILVRRFKK